MKRIFLVSIVLMLTVSLHAQTRKSAKTVVRSKTGSGTAGSSLKTNNDSISYALGIFLSENLKSLGVNKLNFALLNSAVTQSLNKQKTFFDMNQANAILQMASQQKTMKTAAIEKEKGREFLVKNKTRKEIAETPSGLQYEVLVKGTGPVPKREDTVTAHYKGSLLDGKEFDNSYKRGEPLTTPVAGVIPGWTEALTMMPVGSKWKLYIPSSIGYGDGGAGQDIPGGSTLVFEVELLGIGNKKTP